MEQAICTIPGCTDPEAARGWCTRHYTNWYRYGDPLAIVRPPLTGGIYQITGPDRVYVGSAENIRERWKSHRHRLGRGEHHNDWLQADWNMLGPAVFTFSVLEEVPRAEDLIAAEQRHIDTAKASGTLLYNAMARPRAPRRGYVPTDEARQKMSAAASAWMTPENRARKAEAVRGEKNPLSKLDDDAVLAICALLMQGARAAELASEFGVSEGTVYQIRSGRIWTHIVTPEMVAKMRSIRQNPWADGRRTVTDDMRTRFAEVGKSNKGKSPSAERREQISRQSRGEGNPKAKLTEEKVREIIALLGDGATDEDLGARFDVHPNTILKIRTGGAWAHVTGIARAHGNAGVPKSDAHKAALSAAKRGAKATGAILDDDKVAEIKWYLASGRAGARIAEEFGISPMAVSDIKRGRSWSHVPWPDGYEPAATA